MATIKFNTPRGFQDENKSFKALASKLALDDRQIAEARFAGVTNVDEFASFLQQSTHLADEGVYNIAQISAQLAVGDGLPDVMLAENAAAETYALGAVAPPGANFAEKGQQVPKLNTEDIKMLASFNAGPLANQEAVFATICEDWPVRHQGDRGSCVAFATCAAYELFECSDKSVQPDFSEQFLYWAIKHHQLDPWPNKDGTWHRHAATALDNYGLVEESEWAYNPTAIAGNISHNPPPNGAEANAQQWRTTQAVAQSYNTTGGNAAHLLSLLRSHNGVAIALPVFSPPGGGAHNWEANVARSYGFVQSPGPSWFVDGGHAVLCVGFVPDPDEPVGGHFIIRNSWGTNWGHNLPHPDYAGPAPGYGQIPATYIDNFLWETCVF